MFVSRCHTFMFSLVSSLSSLFTWCFVLYCINLYSLLYLDVMNAINERYCLKLSRGPRGPEKLLFFTLH